jgi:FkbM family methyltransferase
MRQPAAVRDFLRLVVLERLRRAGFDVGRWPRRPDGDVLGWSLAAVLRAQQVNCVLDVGANRGQFGQQIRSLGYTGRIVSFEPSPAVFPALSAVAAQDGQWTVRPLALGAKPGEAELHLHVDPVFDSLHGNLAKDAQPDSIGSFAEFTEVDTATVTLSTLAIEYPAAVAGIGEPRVLLKSDTQGNDLDVIAGGAGLSPQVVAVLVELSVQAIYEGQPRMTTMIDTLQEEGFTPVAFQPVSRSFDNLRVVEFDGLFMRPGVTA